MADKPKSSTIKHDYLGVDTDSLRTSLTNRLTYTVGKDQFTATERDWFHSTSYAVRDRLIERWMETMRSYYHQDAKRVYYLSLEFLIGRTLSNSLLNLDIEPACREALKDLGQELESIYEIEDDAALGNGGLGRLAACFLDSIATLHLPGYGYGIRYDYGMFTQQIKNGHQIEHPDNWLRYGNPWEFARPEVLFPVKFRGQVVEYRDEKGRNHHHWIETDDVMAMAYDTPIPGFRNSTVNNMRLWSAKGSRDFNLDYFNVGDYIMAVEEKNVSENLSRVLYPSDSTEMGRELRLQQEYFFVSASLQDIVFRFQKHHEVLTDLPNKVAIQLNDTHPAIAIPELMHILVDHHHLEWEQAWSITTRTFAYTNHTLLPEALETWPVELFGKTLPRHLQIIQEINYRFLNEVMHAHPGDPELLRRMSIFSEEGGQRIRMAHLAIVGSHHVNGVAALHTELMKETIFADFHRYYPEKIINITNGITPRRWLNQANPALSQLITEAIGNSWTTQLDDLKQLIPLAEEKKFRDAFHAVKQQNKQRLAQLIKQNLDIEVRTDSLFDVQIKRIHEYKRQLLNLLHIVTLYNRIRGGDKTVVPRTFILSGKAAPAYTTAKLIIKLANDIADIINNDPAIDNLIKVVYIPNYDVSTAEDIIPAAELSEQISTAGMEASGTGNMKLSLNGALTIGTLDGANIEIRDEVGEENIFIFGHTTESVKQLRAEGYDPQRPIKDSTELRQVLEMVGNGYFSPGELDRYAPLLESLYGGDYYLVLDDFDDYLRCQQRVEELYRDQMAWNRCAILNVANMGKFSSDRSIRDYAEKIWGVTPVVRK